MDKIIVSSFYKYVNLDKLIELLEIDFYNRLINGEVDEAKKTLNFIIVAIHNIKIEWDSKKEVFIAIDKEKAEELDYIISELSKRIEEIFNLSIINVKSLSNEEFARDSKTWMILLKSEFETIVKNMLNLLNTLKNKLQNIEKEKPAERLPEVIYADRYLNIKNKFNLEQIEIIDRVELVIRRYIARRIFMRKITDKILTGHWAGHLHAWLSGTLGYYRIVYSWNGNVVTFEIIGKKDDLGLA